MRKYLIGAFAGILIMFTSSVFADSVKQFILTKTSYPIMVYGKEYKNPELPILNYEGNTYVPLKAIGDMLGTSVVWDDQLKQVNIGMVASGPEYSKVWDVYNYLNVLEKNGEKYEIPYFDISWMYQNTEGELFIAIEYLDYIPQLFFIINGSYEIIESKNPYLDGTINYLEKQPEVGTIRDYDNIQRYNLNGELLYSLKKTPTGINEKYSEFNLYNVTNSKEFKASSNPNKPINVIKHESAGDLHLISLDELLKSVGINAEIIIDDQDKTIYYHFN